jgi:cellulose synthase/poly-beta-1,6-N-acetylglucosamine synthase-like glycosyltransferase
MAIPETIPTANKLEGGNPRVSVVVPAYNVSTYIADALGSLAAQTFSAFEALVVDDGSTDDTAQVVQSFCDRDRRFKLLQKPNGGLSSARNYGIQFATGDYIALLDADDTYRPQKLANHVAVLDQHPEIGVVYSASQIIRDDGRPTFMALSGKPIYADPLHAMLCKNFVGHGSNAVFRRCLVDQVGNFDETLRSSEDADFWLRIAATDWGFYRVPQRLCCYRVRPTGLSFNVAQMQRSHEQVMQGALQRSPERVQPMLPTAEAYLYRYLARLSLTAGDGEQARHYIDQAWASDARIFYRDPRSLVTLLAVKLAPLTRRMIQRTLAG